MRALGTAAKIVFALLLPWLLVEAGLRIAGYHAPDNRERVLLFPRFPEFYRPDRDLAWALRPELQWSGLEMVRPFATDAAGNRYTPGPIGAPAVDCFGDSSTFGYGSDDARTYPAVLADLLGRPVRNRGVPGYTSLSARLLAEDDPPPAPVSLIMVGFNDHFPAYRSASEEWWIRRVAYACFASRVCSLFFDRIARPRATTRPPLSEYRPSIDPESFRENLVATVRTLRERGSAPILLVYPSLLEDEDTRRAIAEHWKHPRRLVDANIDAHGDYQEITREVARALEVPLVDLAALFDEKGNETHHIDWVHPNDDGYRLMAEAVLGPVRAALDRP